MKTFKFTLVLRTGENTDDFITLDENIYDIHSKRVNILYVFVITKYLKKVHDVVSGRWPVFSLTFATLCANSAGDRFIMFFLYFQRKQDLTFHANYFL